MSKPKTPQNFHIKEFVPRYYEVDDQNRLLIPCMLRYMQETALRQIIEIKLSFWDTSKLGVTWILRRGQLSVYSLPVLGQKINCISYANGVNKFQTYRDYKILDQEGQVMAAMTSEWVLLNIVSKRLCRIEETLGEIPIYTENALVFEPFTIKQSDNIIHEDNYMVRRYDLDFNGHVNNACYSEWILESLPDSFYKKDLKHYNIQYKREALLKDQLRITHAQISDLELQHTIQHAETEVVLCLAQSKFG